MSVYINYNDQVIEIGQDIFDWQKEKIFKVPSILKNFWQKVSSALGVLTILCFGALPVYALLRL